jgi:hypothetical protein
MEAVVLTSVNDCKNKIFHDKAVYCINKRSTLPNMFSDPLPD